MSSTTNLSAKLINEVENPACLLEVNGTGNPQIEATNDSFENLWGNNQGSSWNREEVLIPDRPGLQASLKDEASFLMTVTAPDPGRDLRLNFVPVEAEDEHPTYVVHVRDLQKLQRNTSRSDRDEFTRLRDADAFLERLSKTGSRRPGDENLVIVVLQLDNLKSIRRENGYHIGNRLIGYTADRLRSLVPKNGLPARLNETTFAYRASTMSPRDEHDRDDAVLDRLSAPIPLEEVVLKPSITRRELFFPAWVVDSPAVMDRIRSIELPA